jgi:hypothetical protein
MTENEIVFNNYAVNLPEFNFDHYNNQPNLTQYKNRIYVFDSNLGGMIILNSDGTWAADIAPWAG